MVHATIDSTGGERVKRRRASGEREAGEEERRADKRGSGPQGQSNSLSSTVKERRGQKKRLREAEREERKVISRL